MGVPRAWEGRGTGGARAGWPADTQPQLDRREVSGAPLHGSVNAPCISERARREGSECFPTER
jgi:hypothetical protein